MTTGNFFLDLFIAGILGQAFHIFAMKIPAVRSRAKVANEPMSVPEYFKSDIVAIIASLIAVLIVVFVIDELFVYKPQIKPFAKVFLIVMGYAGSSILIGILGKADETIKEVVDFKTDKADNVK